MKKTILALALTVPLTFVAACGSGETVESTATGVPTASTVTSTRSTEETTTTETSTSEETETETETETEEPEVTEEPAEEPAPEEGQVDPQAAPPVSDPLLNQIYEEPAPVAGGQAASDADRAEIEQLVRGIYEVNTFHEFLRYVPENTCHEVLAAQGGAQAMDLTGIPDQPLQQWDLYAASQPHIESVSDVRVDGNRASAVVTAVSAGQSETRTQRYLHEDGRWKYCN